MSLVILRNMLATGTLSKYYLHILDHREHTLSLRNRGLGRVSGSPLKCFPSVLKGWSVGRNRYGPCTRTSYSVSNKCYRFHHNSGCKPCIPCSTVQKVLQVQVNHWCIQKEKLGGWKTPVYTHPTHVHLLLSRVVRDHPSRVVGTHQCRCQVLLALCWRSLAPPIYIPQAHGFM